MTSNSCNDNSDDEVFDRRFCVVFSTFVKAECYELSGKQEECGAFGKRGKQRVE